MVFKASILLLSVFLLGTSFSSRATPMESDLNEAIKVRDWPEVVLLLEPGKGQNFEHDFILTKAYLSLERRLEALDLALKLWIARKDERSRALLELSGSLFFTAEASSLYYEAVRFLSIAKFPEAKERLEQALAKEPNQVLVLTRLIQCEIFLGLKEKAIRNLKLAQTYAPHSQVLKLFGAKLALESEEEQDWYREFFPLKSALLENPVTATYWLEALKRSKRDTELRALSEQIKKQHGTWVYTLIWIYKNVLLEPKNLTSLKSQIDKNLKEKEKLSQTIEEQMKKSDYFWSGYFTLESLLQSK